MGLINIFNNIYENRMLTKLSNKVGKAFQKSEKTPKPKSSEMEDGGCTL